MGAKRPFSLRETKEVPFPKWRKEGELGDERRLAIRERKDALFFVERKRVVVGPVRGKKKRRGEGRGGGKKEEGLFYLYLRGKREEVRGAA